MLDQEARGGVIYRRRDTMDERGSKGVNRATNVFSSLKASRDSTTIKVYTKLSPVSFLSCLLRQRYHLMFPCLNIQSDNCVVCSCSRIADSRAGATVIRQ